ncbi:RNA recognition motif containing protein [Nitzschia inconspicua]|uniref:RNA recognition motif containing protein n=1 Tax=Nitzschia inconspicua TaxID=303405 RepID=A0A9K3PP51_9STRA|nr:RNA recognition motif containing protein [Nitzschia inconspicua]
MITRKRKITFRSRPNCLLFVLALLFVGSPSISAQGPTVGTTQAPSISPPSSSENPPSDAGSTTSNASATASPTLTPGPSFLSSDTTSLVPTESEIPSGAPSMTPTDQPTFDEPIVADARFRQKFLVGNGRIFNENEVTIFETLYQGYTKVFAQIPDAAGAEMKIVTTCNVDNQEALDERRFLRVGHERDFHELENTRNLQESVEAVNIDYTMTYTSLYFNVSSYPILFQNWINQNLETVTGQMQLLQLNVTEAQTASRLIVRTPAPTISFMPSDVPTGRPTVTPNPSFSPTGTPSQTNSSPSSSNDNAVVVIIVSLIVGISIVGIGLLIYCRKRLHRRGLTNQNNATKHIHGSEGPNGGWNGSSHAKDEAYDGVEYPEKSYGLAFRKYADPSVTRDRDGVPSPIESRVSNQSFLSAGNSMDGDSGDEADATQIFADEFDQYKDQNLEKMRADIEGNLEGCDGMMSQAVARALIDEDDMNFGSTDYLWGGDADVTGPEIEASALGDVMDWLKRNDKASLEEKRAFMQDTLNRMVASVRHGVLGPSDASRTIHECAALLGLQLAAEIPVTTVVISGMRKNVTAQDIIDTFSEFGNVSTAAVAPSERGFGILRFKNGDSVDAAMKKYRKEEVVVQDVGVQLKVIKPGLLEGDTSNGAH